MTTSVMMYSNASRNTNAMMSVTRLKMMMATATRFLSVEPASAASIAVIVVPRSAPMATAAAEGRSITPANSALSVIMIVAELDWIIAVTATPTSRNTIGG